MGDIAKHLGSPIHFEEEEEDSETQGDGRLFTLPTVAIVLVYGDEGGEEPEDEVQDRDEAEDEGGHEDTPVLCETAHRVVKDGLREGNTATHAEVNEHSKQSNEGSDDGGDLEVIDKVNGSDDKKHSGLDAKGKGDNAATDRHGEADIGNGKYDADNRGHDHVRDKVVTERAERVATGVDVAALAPFIDSDATKGDETNQVKQEDGRANLVTALGVGANVGIVAGCADMGLGQLVTHSSGRKERLVVLLGRHVRVRGSIALGRHVLLLLRVASRLHVRGLCLRSRSVLIGIHGGHLLLGNSTTMIVYGLLLLLLRLLKRLLVLMIVGGGNDLTHPGISYRRERYMHDKPVRKGNRREKIGKESPSKWTRVESNRDLVFSCTHWKRSQPDPSSKMPKAIHTIIWYLIKQHNTVTHNPGDE